MLRNKDDTRTRLYLGISGHDTPVTRRIRRANSNWPPFEFAAGLHLDDGYRATRVPPLFSRISPPPLVLQPPPSSSLPPLPPSLPPHPVHASLGLVLRCRMGNAVSPPKRVSCPPSRAFQSVFCHLEVCVVTRSRLRSRCFPFGSTGGKRKREEEERIKSLVEQQTYICPVHRYPVTRSSSVLSSLPPSTSFFARIESIRPCTFKLLRTTRGSRFDFLPFSSLSFPPCRVFVRNICT